MGTIIDRNHITGLVLAGGQGSRMGGADKGLQLHRGQPLALHALKRLAPQVGTVLLNANRNLTDYAAMGVPVLPDLAPDGLPSYAGPMAGFAAGLARCETPYLVTVPCDSPLFPLDLVQRLAEALTTADADIAMPTIDEDGVMRPQPVFCLMKASVRDSLLAFTASGQGKIDRWAAQHRVVRVPFGDRQAFFNANTLDELNQLEHLPTPPAAATTSPSNA